MRSSYKTSFDRKGKRFSSSNSLLLLPILLLLIGFPAAASAKQGPVTVHVRDRNGVETASAPGAAIKDRVIRTNCAIIVKWLDKLENNLVVKTGDGALFAIDKVLFNDCRNNIVHIRIEGKALIPAHVTEREPEQKVPPKPAPDAPEPRLPKTSVEKPAAPSAPPRPTAEMLLQTGLNQFNAKKYADAVETLSAAVLLRPDFGEARETLALAYYKLGKYREASEAYGRALRSKPDSLPLYHKLGALNIMLGKYSAATDTFRQALRLDPRNAVTHYNLGIALFLNKEVDTAFKEYSILKDIDGDYAEKLFDLLYP